MADIYNTLLSIDLSYPLHLMPIGLKKLQLFNEIT
jgi:hypothetical protein